MKHILKKILNMVIRVIAIIIHPILVKFIAFILTSLTTHYIVKQLKRCGTNPTILFPITSIGLRYVEIGDSFVSYSRLRIEAYSEHLDTYYNPQIIIGDNVRIGSDCHIGCVNKVIIGNNVLIASKVFISDHSHGETNTESLMLPPNSRKVVSKGPIIIEENVWIGEGVAILPNVTIGKNTIIGANAVVTKDIPANSIVGGNPAKIIKRVIMEGTKC